VAPTNEKKAIRFVGATESVIGGRAVALGDRNLSIDYSARSALDGSLRAARSAGALPVDEREDIFSGGVGDNSDSRLGDESNLKRQAMLSCGGAKSS
jgi:hypothetical protein